ncbi:MAG: hypothetical protein ACJ8FY_26660 [Gemmataceae bacterium]
MTHAAADHGHPDLPFTTAQVDWFQGQDRLAAKMIIGLMASIFTTGLIIYAIVAMYVLAG